MLTGTLGYVVSDGLVLLGEKKKGTTLGEGTLNGAGGKVDECDDGLLEKCLVREVQEEFGITPTDYSKHATITFFAAGVPDFEVHVYLITEWLGEISETQEMYFPRWYSTAQTPFERMLESDQHWLGRLLAGEKFNAHIHYRSRARDFERIEFLPFAP